jgi:hypothetical protein
VELLQLHVPALELCLELGSSIPRRTVVGTEVAVETLPVPDDEEVELTK